MSDEVLRFSNFLASWAEQFRARSSSETLAVDLPHDFHHDEAAGFLRALDSEIVQVNDTGQCSLPAIHRSGTKPTEPCLFSIRQGSIYLAWREYFTQIGALASLVLDYRWPVNLVALDPRNWEFDVAGFSSESVNASMLVAGETKKTQKELSKLLSQLLGACKSSLTLAQLGSNDGHKKYRGLLQERPPFFWAVSPGVRQAFAVHYANDTARVEELPDLPPYPVIVDSKQ